VWGLRAWHDFTTRDVPSGLIFSKMLIVDSAACGRVGAWGVVVENERVGEALLTRKAPLRVLVFMNLYFLVKKLNKRRVAPYITDKTGITTATSSKLLGT